MIDFELGRKYPLAQILEESLGCWIVPGLIKGTSTSQAVILLRPSEELPNVEIQALSVEECLVHFSCDIPAKNQTIYQQLGNLKTLWVFVAKNDMGTLFRVVSRPVSFRLNPAGRFTLSIPMSPPLSVDELHQLGADHFATVTVNENDHRLIRSQSDIEQLFRHLRGMPSFCLQVVRREGDMLDLSVDRHGALVNYLDIRRSVKKVSHNNDSQDRRFIRMKIDALPNLDLEVERYHLVPLERGLGLLRYFLSHGEPAEMVRWPLDD